MALMIDNNGNPIGNTSIFENSTIRRTRNNITNNLSNLSIAIAEQNLEKYGYTIGDYFVGNSGYKYHIADLDTFYGGYVDHSVVNTHHISVVVDTDLTSSWLSSGSVSNYGASTLHSFLTGTVLTAIKSDFTALFGDWSNHLISHQVLNNSIGAWGGNVIWMDNIFIIALNEIEVYGSRVFGADGFQTGCSKKKLEIFNKYAMNEIFGNKDVWLKSLASSTEACSANMNGAASKYNVSNTTLKVIGLVLFY